MFDLRTIISRTDRALLADSRRIVPEDPKQRRLMIAALSLLLLALGIVLWRDRDFWLLDSEEAELDQPIESSPAAQAVPAPTPRAAAMPGSAATLRPKQKAKRHAVLLAHASAAALAPDTSEPTSPITVTSRTVLPPLEVEVVAGDTHRRIRPGSSSVRVDLQPGTPAQPLGDPVTADTETAANVTSDAVDRVQMSANASEIVARPVSPNYPLLARQMKVQGSVILKALIGRDGIIQNLRVISGPRILASAAEDAVRQWHFKPHLEGSEAVETEAKITVNFTISTN